MAEIAIWGGADPVGVAELAMRRYGPDARLRGFAKPEEALAFARAGSGAVLNLEGAPWWARLLAEPRIQAVDLLVKPGLQALAVGAPALEPTGSDQTLWITDSRSANPDIEEALGRVGFAGDYLFGAGGLKLFALAGYVQRDDRRLLTAPGRLSGVIGVAPASF